MLLYHTTAPSTAPRWSGQHGRGTTVFTEQPLAGVGPHVWVLDVSPAEAQAWKFNPELQRLDVGYYQVPNTVIEAALKQGRVLERRYEDLTARPWTHWVLSLRGPTADPAHRWAQVWSSRPGVAASRWMDPAPSGARGATIWLRDTFDPRQDYLVLESFSQDEKEWTHELLAGVPPEWVAFPALWEEWVWDEATQASAWTYLTTHFAAILATGGPALRSDDKLERIRAWRYIARRVGETIAHDLGKIRAGSWTSVTAMPLRIARRVTELAADTVPAWEPPTPQPGYAPPDASGRILLISGDPKRAGSPPTSNSRGGGFLGPGRSPTPGPLAHRA